MTMSSFIPPTTGRARNWVRVAALCILLAGAHSAFATNLRGLVTFTNRMNGYTIPWAGVRVDLWVWQGRWVQMAYYFTGADGMYYFQGIYPGYRVHIQVNGGPYYPVDVLNIPLQDVAPINL